MAGQRISEQRLKEHQVNVAMQSPGFYALGTTLCHVESECRREPHENNSDRQWKGAVDGIWRTTRVTEQCSANEKERTDKGARVGWYRKMRHCITTSSFKTAS